MRWRAVRVAVLVGLAVAGVPLPDRVQGQILEWKTDEETGVDGREMTQDG